MGEITCRGRVLITVDMTRRPPLGLVTATFEIDMEGCPEGTVLTDGHVHDNAPEPRPAPPGERLYMDTKITRSSPLIGGSGLVVSTNPGVDPRVVNEILTQPDRYVFEIHMFGDPFGIGAGRGVLRRV